ncbi:Type II restriction endonuclease [Rickettsia helvetica]|uniref:hypothetical protein n=1 Tax=Rickettsia helvetica TaxID=35789 RepID=UPI0033BBF35F
MKRKDPGIASQEIYSLIELDLKNIFPLEYNKQEAAIKYITEQLAATGFIQKSNDYPELDEEINLINNRVK